VNAVTFIQRDQMFRMLTLLEQLLTSEIRVNYNYLNKEELILKIGANARCLMIFLLLERLRQFFRELLFVSNVTK